MNNYVDSIGAEYTEKQSISTVSKYSAIQIKEHFSVVQ